MMHTNYLKREESREDMSIGKKENKFKKFKFLKNGSARNFS